MSLRFGEILAKALADRQLSQRSFAKLVHAGTTLPHQVISGTRLPPLDQLERWATVLQLTGKARADFILAGNLEHTPALIRERLEALEKGQRPR
jgi:hypothetical protein